VLAKITVFAQMKEMAKIHKPLQQLLAIYTLSK